MIKKRGDKFVVTNKAGTKILGTHSSKKKAAKQLAAIEISKAKHMSENKRFKAFRSELNESEYKETLTGYPNRGIDNENGPYRFDSAMLAKINAMLNAISRSTYQSPSEAFIKIKTRLNLMMLDFPWTPGAWGGVGQVPPGSPLAGDGSLGVVTLTVTRFGRVDGFDGITGQIRMDGKANGTTPFQEFTLLASIEMAEDGLYRVNAKLMPKADVVVAEEGVEHDGDSLDEMAQTAGRFKEMGKKISATERDLERAIGTKRIGGTTTRLLKLYDKDAAEARSEKLYGRGGKVLKRKPDPNKGDVQEMAQTPARQRDMEHKIQRHEDKASRGYSAKMTMSGKAGERGRKQEARHDRASQRLIKQDRKEWESPYLYGRGGKILTSKGKKKKDPDFMKKVKVKEEVEQIDELSKATKDAYVAKRGSQLSSMLSGHTRGKQLTGKQQANAVKGIKQAMGVSEELVGGQKKIDANKNGKLDAQDFKMLRAKKKPVQEEAVAEAKKFKAWTPRLDKLMKNRDAVRVTPKKKTVKEYTEMMGGISLTTPDPTESIAGKQGSGRKFHKKAQKNVAEAMKKPSKPIKKTLKNKKKSKGSDYVHDWETKKIDSRDSTWW